MRRVWKVWELPLENVQAIIFGRASTLWIWHHVIILSRVGVGGVTQDDDNGGLAWGLQGMNLSYAVPLRPVRQSQTSRRVLRLQPRQSAHTAPHLTMSSDIQRIPIYTPTYHPIQNPATTEWELPITRADYDKLLQGFTPRDMDDKWLCITDEPDSHGNTTVHWYRSWTDTEHFRIIVEVGKSETVDDDGSWARFSKIFWEREVGSLEVPAEEVRESIVGLSRGFLGCKLEKAGPVRNGD